MPDEIVQGYVVDLEGTSLGNLGFRRETPAFSEATARQFISEHTEYAAAVVTAITARYVELPNGETHENLFPRHL